MNLDFNVSTSFFSDLTNIQRAFRVTVNTNIKYFLTGIELFEFKTQFCFHFVHYVINDRNSTSQIHLIPQRSLVICYILMYCRGRAVLKNIKKFILNQFS